MASSSRVVSNVIDVGQEGLREKRERERDGEIAGRGPRLQLRVKIGLEPPQQLRGSPGSTVIT